MSETGKRRLCILFGILVFFVAGGGLSASGSGEQDIESARRLIGEKRYNDALLILTEVIRNDSEKVDEAEGLIRLVRSYLSNYNDRYEELISVLYEEQDVEKALRIIRELEELDPNPNAATASALARAKESASFIYEQQQFTRIMNQALVLLNEGRFWEAVALYESGIGLGRDRFNAAQYGNIAENRVDAVLAGVRQNVSAFRAAEGEQRQALEELRAAAGAGDTAAFQAAAARYLEVYRPVARMARDMDSAVSELQAQNAVVLPEREDLFLGYTGRFIGGRQNSEEPEGLKGAAQRLVAAASGPAIEALLDRAQALLAEGEASLERPGRDWNAARLSFMEAGRLSGEAARLFALRYEALPVQGAAISAEIWKAAAGEIPLYLRMHTIRAAADGYTWLAGYAQPADESGRAAYDTLADLREYRAGLVSVAASIGELQNAWREFSGAAGENPLASDGTREFSRVYGDYLALWQERFAAIEVRTVERIAAMQIVPVTEGVASAGGDYSAAREYMDGIAREREIAPGVHETVTAYYPAEALAIFTRLPGRLDTLESSAQTFLADIAGGETRLAGDPAIARRIAEAHSDVTEIQRLRALIASGTADARARTLQAERYKNEGNLRLAEIQAAINAGNFEAGKRALASARQSFSNSLAIQDDEALSRESDARLIALDTSLREAENSRVIAEVRSLTEQGRRLYEEGRYIEAENVLSRAQVRWETTQTAEEPVIAYWLGFVRTALFVGASREILVTDPLYNEMNQLLNLAREDYTWAQSLVSDGNRRAALTRLTSADEKIAQVRKAFPNNQAAGVLTLRITFLRDERDASVMFRNMFNAAVAKIDRNNRTQTLEAYTELLDLRVINPNYAGIGRAVYDAEIALGIRLPPPDPRAIAESNRLTREADVIVRRSETSQYPLAMEMVTQALRLNPDNRQAMEIRLRLADVGGGTVVNVLPSAAQAQFIQAQQLFNQQNYFEALAIVERLLQTPEGRNYPPLQDLKRRIESLI